MTFLLTAAYFVLLLGGLIFFHELGHFLVARLMGVHVTTFSIGFGPPLLKIRGRKPSHPAPPTEYVVAALPFGGYVKMLGDDPSEDVPDSVRAISFNHKAVWQRFLIVCAGPVFNLVLPYFILFGGGLLQTELSPSTIGMLDERGPAATAGMLPGDKIVAIDGEEVGYWYQLQETISEQPDVALQVSVERAGSGQVETLTITPQRHREQLMKGLDVHHETGRIGIVSSYMLPYVAVVDGSPAHAAGVRTGDLVTAVDGEAITSYDDLLARVAAAKGRPFELTWTRHALNPDLATTGEVVQGTSASGTVAAAGSLGQRGLASLDCAVRAIDPDSPASEVGLEPGDIILGMDDRDCRVWSFFQSALNADRTGSHTLTWAHGEMIRTATSSSWIGLVSPDPVRHPDLKWETVGVRTAGGVFHSPAAVPIEDGLAYAIGYSIRETHDYIIRNVAAVVGLLRGAVPMTELSGPVGIAVLVSKTTEYGWGYFFSLMVWLSISLGLINLLPIPVLDGGHIVFLGIEAVRRRPVSLRTRQIATYIGLAFIILLMVVVIKFDIERPWS